MVKTKTDKAQFRREKARKALIWQDLKLSKAGTGEYKTLIENLKNPGGME